MNRVALIVSLISFVLAALALNRTQERTAFGGEEQRGAAIDSDLVERLRALEEKVESLGMDVDSDDSPTRRDAFLVDEGAKPAAKRSLLPEGIPYEAVDAENRAVADVMETRFSGMLPGTAGDKALEESIVSVISTDIPAVQGRTPGAYEVECRQGMCRVVARFGSEGAAYEWADVFLAGISADLPRSRIVAVRGEQAGSYDLLVYAVRPGYEQTLNLRKASGAR